MSIFGNIFKKKATDPVSGSAISPEIYESIRVMRDDVNELEGKPKESFQGSSSASNPAQANNPFLGADSGAPLPAMPDAPKPAATPQAEQNVSVPIPSESATAPAPVSVDSRESSPGLKKWIFIGIVSVVIVVAGVSAYLFFKGNPMKAPGSGATSPVETGGLENPVELPSVPTSEFSTENPNYLMLDPESESATPEGIREKLSETEEGVRAMAPSEPIEFLVRDANGNPIAFPRFAYLMKLGIPEETLSLIDEAFSIYVVPDGGDLRFALALETKDETTLAALIAKEEGALPSWFDAIFYPVSVMVPETGVFRPGTHGTIGTRFAIIDAERNYSLDYAFVGKKWILGTSKDSFRSVLERSVLGK